MTMKKLFCVTVFLGALSAEAQIPGSLDVSVGFGFGFGTGSGIPWEGTLPANASGGRYNGELEFSDYEEALSDARYDEYRELNTSLGDGLKLDITGTWFFTDNVGVMAATGLSLLGGFRSEVDGIHAPGPEGTDITSRYSYELTIRSGFVPLNVGLKIRSTIDIIEPYVYLAPGIYIPFAGGEMNFQGVPETRVNQKIEIDLSTGFGFAAGMGASLELWDRMGVRAELCPIYAFTRLREVRKTYTHPESELEVTDRIVYERKEPALTPDDLDDRSTEGTTEYRHGQPTLSLGSMNLKVAFYMHF